MTETLRYFVAPIVVSWGILGLALGGAWSWLGLLTFAALSVFDFGLGADHARRCVRHPWVAESALYVQYFFLLTLWGLFLWRLGPGGEGMTTPDRVGAMISVAYLTSLGGLPAAHELMHRKNPVAIAFAHLYGTFYLAPFNDLAHVHGHHNLVGTPRDTDTPKRGQTVYSFIPRAAFGQLVESIRIEASRLRKRGMPLWSWRGRIFWGIVTEGIFLATVFAVAGTRGIGYTLATWAVGYFILQGFNYTQHYGLVRLDGTPILPHHSWNHLTVLDRALAYEITTHSEHHLDADAEFWRLEPHPEAPQMPSIILCFIVSMIPPVWHRWIAMPRLRHWDLHYASPAERKLAAEANARAGWPSWLPEAQGSGAAS
jgi:toluene methyl-monooxygenase